MSGQQPLIRDPAAYLWAVAVRTAASRKFQFSPRCKASLQEKINAGLKVYRVGAYEFRERLPEAEENIKKLLGIIISQELAANPDLRLLQESSLLNALYTEKLCPGLWPIC